MEIAILMLIHKYSSQQERLINHLSKDFKIFIHIDKSTDISIDLIKKNKNVFVYKKYNVYWGSYNQILATIFLLKEAHKITPDRYIFISGEDIPLKSNKEIIKFFINNNDNYMSFEPLPKKDWTNQSGGYDRCDYFWLNSYRGKLIKSKIIKKLISEIQYINEEYFITFCKKRNIKRSFSRKVELFGGANWMDLTNDCVSEILKFLKDNPKYLRYFKYTRCADEIFFQTLIINYLKDIKIKNQLLRYIDWQTGPDFPRILKIEDFDKMINSNFIFARKVNEKIDISLIDKIYSYIQ